MNDIFIVRSFNGKHFFLCDPSDAPRVTLHNWTRNKQCGYAQSYTSEWGFMHRLIMTPPVQLVVHHKNEYTFDNRRSNLESVTHTINLHKAKKLKQVYGTKTTSKYKGVHWYKPTRKWCAHIKINGRNTNLGYFISETQAAFVYNKKALEAFGPGAFQNTIEQEGISDKF